MRGRELHERIIDLRAQNLSREEVAKRLGVSIRAVDYHSSECKCQQTNSPAPRGKRERFAKLLTRLRPSDPHAWARHRAILALYHNGESIASIARRFALTPSAVIYHVKGRCSCGPTTPGIRWCSACGGMGFLFTREVNNHEN